MHLGCLICQSSAGSWGPIGRTYRHPHLCGVDVMLRVCRCSKPAILKAMQRCKGEDVRMNNSTVLQTGGKLGAEIIVHRSVALQEMGMMCGMHHR